MKIKLLVLLTGTFLAVAYLIGCGGGGNNNNTSCPAGQTYVNGVCQVGVGVNGYGNCQQYINTPTYATCMAQSGCGAGVGVAGGMPPYYGGGYSNYGGGYGNYGGAYQGGVAGYPGQNCGGVAGGYSPVAGVYPPYPPQGGGYIYQPYPPIPPPYYGPYAPPGISWGVGVNLH